MKKIWLTKSNNNNLVENANKNIYIKRKAMQPAYQDLFQALLRLPDRQVQARVLDAINDQPDKRKTVAQEIFQTCDKCKSQKTEKTFIDAGTQTTVSTISDKIPTKVNSNSEESCKTPISTPPPLTVTNVDSSSISESKTSIKDVPKKRKQKRKVRAPHVIKKSQAKQLQEQQQTFSQKRKVKSLKSNDETLQTREEILSPTCKRLRSDSINSTDIAEGIDDASLWDSPDDKSIFIKIMKKEFYKAEIIQADGFLPIHSAIINDDLRGLKRQIIVWTKLKNVDLNELYTDDDEDCLQLAVIQNTSYPIVDELIRNGLDINTLDSQSNNLIHLAILNEVDNEILQLLLDRIDLEILLNLNDDGFTPLHLTVRQDKFLMTEIILNTIDKRCFGHLYYSRKRNLNDGKESFLKYYEKCCDHLQFERSMLQQSKVKQKIKRCLLDRGDMRSGSTALYYALENKFDHLIYLLLAHFSDPRIRSHSGQSSRDFLGEFGKSLNLSLKIDRVMEEIENLLDK